MARAPVNPAKMEFEKSILSKRSDGAAMPVTVADGIHLLTFHCQHCYTVLADSLHVCGELKSLDSVILLSRFVSCVLLQLSRRRNLLESRVEEKHIVKSLICSFIYLFGYFVSCSFFFF